MDGQQVDSQIRHRHLGQRAFLVDVQQLVDRRTVRQTLDLEFVHQALEGQILMIVGFERRPFDLGEELLEGRIGVEPAAQDNGVDE